MDVLSLTLEDFLDLPKSDQKYVFETLKKYRETGVYEFYFETSGVNYKIKQQRIAENVFVFTIKGYKDKLQIVYNKVTYTGYVLEGENKKKLCNRKFNKDKEMQDNWAICWCLNDFVDYEKEKKGGAKECRKS